MLKLATESTAITINRSNQPSDAVSGTARGAKANGATARANSERTRRSEGGWDRPTRLASSLLRMRPSCCNSDRIFRSIASSGGG
jgi:hypothetical protein